jgi:hypothetical protein
VINLLDLEFKFVEMATEILLAIWANDNYCETITCKVRKYDYQGDPLSWGIYKGNLVLSKDIKVFCIEPLPSNRDEYFDKEFRFPSSRSAIKFFRDNFKNQKINKTIEENIGKLDLEET